MRSKSVGFFATYIFQPESLHDLYFRKQQGKKNLKKMQKTRNFFFNNRFLRVFFDENRLLYILPASRNFEPNPPRHLGRDSQPSPYGQTGFAVNCGSDFSFAYLQIQAPLEFG
jgi:hypothetical protein